MTTPTGNPFVNSILWGGWSWSGTVTYFFDDNSTPWEAVEKAAYRKALAAWASVADVTFTEVFSEGAANLVEHTESEAVIRAGLLGWHETPEDAQFSDQAHGHFNWQQYGYPTHGGTPTWHPAGLVAGGYGYHTYLHELGHALGLAHPHDKGGGSTVMPGVTFGNDQDTGNFNLNQSIYTAMSYVDGWALRQDPFGHGVSDAGYNSGPGAFDIAAMQHLYGANMGTGAGNNTYWIPKHGGWQAIWDSGGNDTLRSSGRGDAVINLGSATLDNSPTGGGALSYIRNAGNNDYFGGYTIAGDFTNVIGNVGGETGVIIENATGGGGDDRIVGNGVANTLRGGRGDDVVNGGSGNDLLAGGTGNDRLSGNNDLDVLIGAGGDDRLYGGGRDDRLSGGNNNDVLVGNGGHDRLDGGAHRDTLHGGGGNDWLRGAGAPDRFVFVPNFGVDRIADMTDDIDTIVFDDALWGGGMTAQQVVDTFAVDIGADIRFVFAGGERLTVLNFADRADLYDDIAFI